MALSEADTCRRFITPALVAAGRDSHDQIAQQRSITAGRVVVSGRNAKRRPPRRADYILRYTRDNAIGVVEAKAIDVPAHDGLQQAMEYAQMLGLPFAYAANGKEIIEHDFLTGVETQLEAFPGPGDLWARWRGHQKLDVAAEKLVLTPYFLDPQRTPRYYQYTAINRAVEAFGTGQERVLLTLATGTGKSFIAFQVCWRLWKAGWNRKGKPQRPKILYLADRNVLVGQPRKREFAPFEDAAHLIDGQAVLSREMYFSTYQMIAKDERRPGLYKDFPRDFFDLVVVDECHRGSAADDSNWREILNYFTGATKLGMTATPLRKDNKDTYAYFGNPVYQYSLKQGIEDGFLAPYKVYRVITDVDGAGWRPTPGQVDRYGEQIPDGLYETPDFERTIVLPQRTKAVAQYITRYLQGTNPHAKTIVFCVDQEHAALMRAALAEFSQAQVRSDPNYVCRCTADEGDIGRGHLDKFQDVEAPSPVILTTSEMLTTGVDAPTVANIAICRVVRSMTTFKQIIGRGTRLREDYGKLFFTILDFTGSATRNFADPDFDGFPASVAEQSVAADPAQADETLPEVGEGTRVAEGPDTPYTVDSAATAVDDKPRARRQKFYVDDVAVEVVADLVYELDADGRRLRTVKLTDYAKENVLTLYRSAADLRAKWIDPAYRQAVLLELEDRGIDVVELAARSGHPESDPFDLLCHVAFSAPLRTRRERAEAVRRKPQGFWDKYTPAAREILSAVLDKYAEHGVRELVLPDVLQVPPISQMGNVSELSLRFGGPASMKAAFDEMQALLYAA